MPWNPTTKVVDRVNPDYTGETVWYQDLQGGKKVIATRHDYHDQDLADAISRCLNIDGVNEMAADLDMQSNNITNLADGASAQDAASFNQLIDTLNYTKSTGAFSLTSPAGLTLSAALPGYSEGTWTPVFKQRPFNSSSYSTAPTHTVISSTGNYTRIGDMVTCWIRIRFKNLTTASNGIALTLPFQAAAFDSVGALEMLAHDVGEPFMYSKIPASQQHVELWRSDRMNTTGIGAPIYFEDIQKVFTDAWPKALGSVVPTFTQSTDEGQIGIQITYRAVPV